ncbi:hypothetical protein R70006_05853 [Paraburkholderia domus]|nr:hypothetical protein R70006_05853 [Paraburkholderia domus]
MLTSERRSPIGSIRFYIFTIYIAHTISNHLVPVPTYVHCAKIVSSSGPAITILHRRPNAKASGQKGKRRDCELHPKANGCPM